MAPAGRIKLPSILCVLFMISVRGFLAQPMHSPKDDTKQIIMKYLDGRDDGIAILGLNRPRSRNALGKVLLSQLKDAISTIRKDRKVRVVILRSLVPRIFCAGADLKERSRMSIFETENFISSLRDLMNKVEFLSAPVISAIDGSALGGGLELALATDIRTASSGAKMGLVETKLAIIPGAGGTQRLPRIVGPAKAKELIFSARVLDAEEAHKIGLVNQVVPQNDDGDAAYQAALSIAREILPNGPIAVKCAKVAISKGYEVPIQEGFEIEKKCVSEILDTKDRIEGLGAFLAKRVPVYRGL